MKNGLFVVIEGPEGFGKSTQRDLLSARLDTLFVPHVKTSQPDYTLAEGARIKRGLKGEEVIDPREFQELFKINREEHVEKVIKPARARGLLTLVDRYKYSSASCGASEGVDPGYIMQINSEFPTPDITIVLQVSIPEALERLRRRAEKNGTTFERFDSTLKLRIAYETYEMLARKHPDIVFVNGEGSESEVSDRIATIVLPMIGEKEEGSARTDSATVSA